MQLICYPIMLLILCAIIAWMVICGKVVKDLPKLGPVQERKFDLLFSDKAGNYTIIQAKRIARKYNAQKRETVQTF